MEHIGLTAPGNISTKLSKVRQNPSRAFWRSGTRLKINLPFYPLLDGLPWESPVQRAAREKRLCGIGGQLSLYTVRETKILA